MIRELIVEKAREWIETPYHHHQRVKGLGVDCVGLIIVAGLESGALKNWTEDKFAPYKGYSKSPNPNHMLKAMEAFLDRVTEPKIGDIAWIEPRHGLPCHLAIKATDTTIIHACATAKKVIENTLSQPPHSWWRYGGLNE